MERKAKRLSCAQVKPTSTDDKLIAHAVINCRGWSNQIDDQGGRFTQCFVVTCQPWQHTLVGNFCPRVTNLPNT